MCNRLSATAPCLQALLDTVRFRSTSTECSTWCQRSLPLHIQATCTAQPKGRVSVSSLANSLLVHTYECSKSYVMSRVGVSGCTAHAEIPACTRACRNKCIHEPQDVIEPAWALPPRHTRFVLVGYSQHSRVPNQGWHSVDCTLLST